MPTKGHISKTRRLWTHVYSLAIEVADPLATQDEIRASVDSQTDMLRTLGLKPLGRARAHIYIRDIQNAHKRQWLDSPWHMGIFAANCAHLLEFPHDQLPVVMAVAMRVFAGGKRLTARQATWVARLNALQNVNLDEASDKHIQHIYDLSLYYSAREITAAVIANALHTDHPPLPESHESDTWDLDLFLGTHDVGYETEAVADPVLGFGHWGGYAYMRVVGIAPDMRFPEYDFYDLRSSTGIADTDDVSEVHQMILEAVPTADENWRTLTFLLMSVRGKSLRPDWQEWSEDDRHEFIRDLDRVSQDVSKPTAEEQKLLVRKANDHAGQVAELQKLIEQRKVLINAS
jgi:hypothetical protein